MFEWKFPTFRWFVGAETNLAYNALDRHVADGRGGHTALIYMNERGERRRFTYPSSSRWLNASRRRCAALGIGKGDRLTIYMPTSPEAIALMLATVRIGAIHSVVFAGFWRQCARRSHQRQWVAVRVRGRCDVSQGQGSRSQDDRRRCAGNWRRRCRTRHRAGNEARSRSPLNASRDITWDAFLKRGEGQSSTHEVDGVQRRRLHPRNLRNDSATEAGRSHPRRLSGLYRHAWGDGASA